MRLLSDDDLLPLLVDLEFEAVGVWAEMLRDAQLGPLLCVYQALTEGRLGRGLSAEDRFNNRFWWFFRSATALHARFGPDAGVEQQRFQLLESASCALAWVEIERIAVAARGGGGA